MPQGWNETHFQLYVRIRKALEIILRKRKNLQKEYGPLLSAPTRHWEDSLPGELAHFVLAARELFSNKTGFGQPAYRGKITLELANTEVYQILLNQQPLFDFVPVSVRRAWEKHRILLAELRDLDALRDPVISARLRAIKRMTEHRKKEFKRAEKARKELEQKSRPQQRPLFHH